MAMVRVSDLVLGGRRIELATDASLAGSDPDERVYGRAAEMIAAARAPVPGIEDAAAQWQPEATYDTTPFPSEPLRLLAVYRLWGILDNFNPYKALADRRWDDAMSAFIPRVVQAQDELQYARAIAEMAARTQDTHVRVSGSRALARYLGEVPPPVLVRYVEGRPIVTRVVDEKAAPGLAPGDEIVAVDGEDIATRARRIEQCVAFSTPASRNGIVAARLLAGDADSVARVAVRGADGRSREVEITRPPKPVPGPQRTGDVFRILDGNIGYADLERLETSQVASMFDQLKGTIGIIFDMRGYPRGTAWSIAPRINTKKATAAALFYRPLVSAGSAFQRLSFMQDLPPTTTWVYDRPTVMLIDERAISQSEHSGLFYKAANGTTFIGSGTTGANGDVTSMVLPGGMRVSFTGHDVRWPDGRQLQRVGLIPDVPVTPTIAGIRAGRDEVLEAAVAFLKKQGKT
jgi:C-terminal processing protease CtpA/Prc